MPKSSVSSLSKRRRVTSADVAREAGVSRATVSYVLNDAPDRKISEETRALVLETAARLGHVPYAPARSLRLGRSNIVLVVVRDLSLGYVASSLLHALDDFLAERGYIVLVDRYDSSVRSLSVVWQLVSPALVVAMGGLSDGFLLSDLAEIEDSSERFLRLQGSVPNTEVGEMQVKHLYERGHRLIGYALPSARTDEVIATERFEGARFMCAALGLPPPVVRKVTADDPASAAAALDSFLAEPGLTAIAAHSDEIGLMLTGWMTARGLTPGTDLAVIGVDDIPAARIGLTTIGINVELWSERVIAAVEELLADRPPKRIPTDGILRLIARETT